MIGILGQGITGRSLQEYFFKKNQVVDLWAQELVETDKRTESLLNWIERCDDLFISPGVNPHQEPYSLIPRNKAMTDIDLFFELIPTENIILVTGTNGKTSLVELLVQILRATGLTVWSGGNNEVPVLTFVDQVKPTDWVVLELSSFQLYWMRSLPSVKVAAVTSFSEDHLNWHVDMKEYHDCKEMILMNAALKFAPDGFSSLPGIDCWNTSWMTYSDKTVLVFDGQVYGTLHLTVQSSPLRYPLHQAFEIAKKLGLAEEPIIKTLTQWSPSAHRFQRTYHQGILWINDTKATNFAAALASLQQLNPSQHKIYVVMGGDHKGQNLNQLASFYPYADKFFLIGHSANAMAKFLGNKAIVIETLERFFDKILLLDRPDIVLLAPGCASLDQFKNYKHRGEVFEQSLMAL
jgi:UDP-N-acetylmuramoylalanine--D-glutamate ligase